MTLWDRTSNFSLHYFEPLEDGPELEPFHSLISVWRSNFDGDRIPKWSDFDFTDFRGWHSRIAIYDITYDPFDFKAKIVGEEYQEIIGHRMQGITRDDLLSIAIEDEISDRFYLKTCSEMLIAYQMGVNIVHRQHIDVTFLELPLSDNGLHATHTIEAVARI